MDAVKDKSWFMRGGLFAKYVISLVGLVVFVLAVNGLMETWIGYRATRTTLTDGMAEKAEATSRHIQQAMSDLERQTSWVTRASANSFTVEQRRTLLDVAVASIRWFCTALRSAVSRSRAAMAESPTARPIAGGTDLMVALTGELGEPPARTVDLWRLDELREITADGKELTLGALTTYTQIRGSALCREHLPGLVEAAATIGAVQIQNRGTLGGNVANASPAGDTLRAWQTNGVATNWKIYARNKKSLSLELRKPAARAVAPDAFAPRLTRSLHFDATAQLSDLFLRELSQRPGVQRHPCIRFAECFDQSAMRTYDEIVHVHSRDLESESFGGRLSHVGLLVLERRGQVHQNQLIVHVTPYDHGTQMMFRGMLQQ